MSLTAIARVRRFNRAVTREVGALDTSFLGRGRPLGAARVLTAIGAGERDVAAIRAHLSLDTGLMSRLLRSLEAEGLIITKAHPEDGRRRTVALTDKGFDEVAAYDQLSDERATAILSRHPDREALLTAMDTIATALAGERITIEMADPESEAAQSCLSAYYQELDRRFPEGFDVTQSRDPEPEAMRAPRGAFLLAMADGVPLGCVGVRGATGGIAEIKRLWVCDGARGFGLGRRLMAEAEETAEALGIAVLRLDTHTALPEAAAFYRRAGWQEIEPFNDDPYAKLFFQKRLVAIG
ncbi:MAG: helix-turn-helix domain-containing GNAT family N-acetyltransferase [Pseudomonadota bacterium]